MTLGVVFGTRPEAIKLGPVVHELRQLGIQPVIIGTGQHTSLLAGTPAESDLSEGFVPLDLPSIDRKVGLWVAHAVPRLMEAYKAHGVTRIVVQGDTMSALAGAWAGVRSDIPVAHVEAGLRSHHPQEPWPEERIRVGISKVAHLHLAPTESAKQNLLAEGIDPKVIHVTGNSVVSAIARYSGAVPQEKPGMRIPTILVTMHRREWIDHGGLHVAATLDAVLDAQSDWGQGLIVWPLHPAVSTILREYPAKRPIYPVLCRPPFTYEQMMDWLPHLAGVATDSGGLQEEAATLGIPCAVLRNVTDRPESIEIGVAKRFDPTPEGMREALTALIGGEIPRRPTNCYGTAQSATNIAQCLATF